VIVIVRKRVLVTGVVQGVWYRGSTLDVARGLPVSGWVRNRSDGSVEAVVEGPAPAVDSLVTWMRGGPPGAIVERVEVTEEDPEGLDGFSIRG
jgi:acylphosphatase